MKNDVVAIGVLAIVCLVCSHGYYFSAIAQHVQFDRHIPLTSVTNAVSETTCCCIRPLVYVCTALSELLCDDWEAASVSQGL